MKALSKEIRLKIYQNVLSELLLKTNIRYHDYQGLCNLIIPELESTPEYEKVYMPYKLIFSRYIPDFNITNARRL